MGRRIVTEEFASSTTPMSFGWGLSVGSHLRAVVLKPVVSPSRVFRIRFGMISNSRVAGPNGREGTASQRKHCFFSTRRACLADRLWPEMIEPTTARVDQQRLAGTCSQGPRCGVGLVGLCELLTRLTKSVLKTTAGHQGNRCQLYCGERARWTQIETQRPGCPSSKDHGVRCLCW